MFYNNTITQYVEKNSWALSSAEHILGVGTNVAYFENRYMMTKALLAWVEVPRVLRLWLSKLCPVGGWGMSWYTALCRHSYFAKKTLFLLRHMFVATQGIRPIKYHDILGWASSLVIIFLGHIICFLLALEGLPRPKTVVSSQLWLVQWRLWSTGLAVNVLLWCRTSIHRSYSSEYGLTCIWPHVHPSDSVCRLLGCSFLFCVQIWSRIRQTTLTTELFLLSTSVDQRSGKWHCCPSSTRSVIPRGTVSRLVGNVQQLASLFWR